MTLETDTAGNQLQEASDVKVRGVIVGDVREVEASRRGRHDRAGDQAGVPRPDPRRRVGAAAARRRCSASASSRSSCRRTPRQERLADGDVIGQDRTENAIELQRVIDDTLPLLQAVQPEDLSFTLGAVADALRGRGDELGANLAATGEYFGEINTVLPELQADISGPGRLRRDLRRRGRRPARRPGQPRRHQHDGGGPGGAVAPHVQRRHELVERDGRLPGDQRAEPHLARGDVPARPRTLRRVLPGLPVPPRRAHPVGAPDRRGVRRRR